MKIEQVSCMVVLQHEGQSYTFHFDDENSAMSAADIAKFAYRHGQVDGYEKATKDIKEEVKS